MVVTVDTPAQRHRMPEVVKSAVRALEILEFFDRWQGPVSVGTIAADLGYPQSSTSALMRSLVKVGYLSYDAHKRTFLPTRRVPLLGSWLGDAFFRDGPLLEVARKLADRTGYAVGIARRNNVQVQWLHAISSPDVSVAEVFSDHTSLTRTAIGLSLLAPLEDRQAHGLVHRINAEAQELNDVVPWSEMRARISDTRRDGYACHDSGQRQMLSMLVPAMATGETIALALVDAGASLHEEELQIVGIMREAIAVIQPDPAPDAVLLRTPELNNWGLMAAHA